MEAFQSLNNEVHPHRKYFANAVRLIVKIPPLGAGAYETRKGRKEIRAEVIYNHCCMKEPERTCPNLRELGVLKFGWALLKCCNG